MAEGTVSQVVARPVRTGVQLIPAAVITEFIDSFFYNLSDKQYAALLSLLLLLTSLIQTLIENRVGKGFLRTVPGKHVHALEEGVPQK